MDRFAKVLYSKNVRENSRSHCTEQLQEGICRVQVSVVDESTPAWKRDGIFVYITNLVN